MIVVSIEKGRVLSGAEGQDTKLLVTAEYSGQATPTTG